MQKGIIAFFLVGLILILAGCGQPSVPPDSQPAPLQSSQRSFEMGFVPVPKQPLSTENWLDAFSVLKANSDFVLHHSKPDWNAFAETTEAARSLELTPNLEGVNFIVLMTRQNSLKVFLVVDPLASDREQIDGKLYEAFPSTQFEQPLSFGSSFVRDAFKNYAVRLARDYKPEIMGLGSEVNTYMQKHPEDADNLVSLIRETAVLVKQESPNTKITATMQFESLTGTFGSGSSQWEIFNKITSIVDYAAITTYPSLVFENPEKIPENYYSQLNLHTSKPIIIAESGWPTGGSSEFHGSSENQKDFVAKIPELAKEINLKLWIWWFLHDWQGEGYPDYFKTMGLKTSDGQEKPAWKTWQQIFALPKK